MWFFYFIFVSLLHAKKHKMIIKHANIPTCHNCLFYRAPSSVTSSNAFTMMGHCTKFGSKHIVTGHINFLNAYQSRTQEEYCGVEGREFVSLPRQKNNLNKIKRRILMQCRLWWRWFLRLFWKQGCDCICEEDGCKVIGCDNCEVVPLLRFLTRK